MMTPMCSRTTQLRFCCQTKTQSRFQWKTFFLGDPPLFREGFQMVRRGSMFSAVSVFPKANDYNLQLLCLFFHSHFNHQNHNHRTLFWQFRARYLNTFIYTSNSPKNNFVSYSSTTRLQLTIPVEPLLKIDFLNKTQNNEWSKVKLHATEWTLTHFETQLCECDWSVQSRQ